VVDLRIGQLARAAGIPASAIRYYERHGLLPLARRTEAGYRLYEEEAVARLRFIQRAKALGLSLAEIKQLLDSPDATEERARLRHLVAHKLGEIKGHVEELNLLSETIKRLYVRLSRDPQKCGCRHFGDCDCTPLEPTSEEVMRMATEIEKVETASGCSCGCEPCATTGRNCGCRCCGTAIAHSEPQSVSATLSKIPMGKVSGSCNCGSCS